MNVPDFDTASPSELRRYGNEMFAKSRATQREVESYARNFPVPAPSTIKHRPTLPIPLRGEPDQSEMARARRRARGLALIENEERREAEQQKQTEAEQVAAWRAESPLGRIMR